MGMPMRTVDVDCLLIGWVVDWAHRWILRARDRDRDILTRLRLGHQRPVNRGCPIVRFRGSLWQVTQPFPEIGQWPY